MSRYKINIDNTSPSKAKIDAYKDFDTLQKRYQVQSRYDFWRRLYRNPRYFAILVALVSVSILVYQSSLEESPATAAFISPPIPPKNIPPIIQEVNSDSEQVFSYANGTKVHIPAAAFVDSIGRPIQGKIELRYREFRDAADIFIAGIPMEYDSANKVHTLESAAMLEVLAYSENKPIFLKEGKTLEVEYYSPVKGTDFSVYHLDTMQRNWHYEGKDMLREVVEERVLSSKPELNYLLDVKADTFLTRNVDIPVQKPGKVFQLTLSNADDFGMLAGKKQIIWEYLEVSGFSDPWKEGLLPTASAVARATPYRAAGIFTLEMKGGIRFIARPLLKATSFEAAQTDYLIKRSTYEKALNAWNAQRTLTQKRMEEREAAKKEYEERLAAWEKEHSEITNLGQKGTYRKFILQKLGINQLARIIDFPLMQVKLGFNSAEDNKFGETLYQNGRKINMILPGINTVFSCKAISTEKGQYLVSVDPNKENLLLTSDADENLYLLNFRKIPANLSLAFGKSEQFLKDHASIKRLLLEKLSTIQAQK